jgi:hypothetical protein
VKIDSNEIQQASQVKKEIKKMLNEKFKINHSTLEIEFCENDCMIFPQFNGHSFKSKTSMIGVCHEKR